MSLLPLLVQLPDLRAQGSFDQHVDLPPLCDQPALIPQQKPAVFQQTGRPVFSDGPFFLERSSISLLVFF